MTIKYFLTVGFEGTDDIGVQGLITERDDGTTHYRSYTQSGNSRKPKASVAAAIPRTFTGYIICTDSLDQSIRSTKAFRLGEHWAMHANSIGDIHTVRNGRVEE